LTRSFVRLSNLPTYPLDRLRALIAARKPQRGATQFRAAWECHCEADGWLDEFLAMKRQRRFMAKTRVAKNDLIDLLDLSRR
jgi:hypothetical protein